MTCLHQWFGMRRRTTLCPAACWGWPPRPPTFRAVLGPVDNAGADSAHAAGALTDGAPRLPSGQAREASGTTPPGGRYNRIGAGLRAGLFGAADHTGETSNDRIGLVVEMHILRLGLAFR